MENKMISALLLLSAGLWIQPLCGQITIPTNYQLKHSFQSVNEEYYLIEDTLTLSPAERIEAMHSLEIYQTDRYLDENGQKSTILSLLGSNSSETWMNLPYYFVVTAEGAFAYDINQNLLLESPHSSFYQERIAYNGSEFFPSFPTLSDARKEELQQSGIMVSGNPANPTLMFGNRKLTFNQANKTIEIKEFDDQQNLINTTKIGYTTLSGGENVMTYLKEIQSVTLSGGTCAKKINTKTFSNHQVSYGKKKSPKSVLAQSSFTIHPNPVGDEIILNTTGSKNDSGIFRIFNSEGRLVLMQTIHLSLNKQIPVQTLKPGVYIFHLQTGEINETLRFVKN